MNAAPARGILRAVEFAEFQTKISSKRAAPAPVCAFVGQEEFLRTEGERLVRRAVFGETEPELGVVAFDGPRNDAEASRLGAAAVLDEASSLPLLVKRKVVILRDADLMLSSHREAFERYVERPCESTVLILECEKLPRNTRLAKAIESAGGYVECKRLYETAFGETEVTAGSPLVRWVTSRARSRGVELEGEAACELVRRLGGSLRELDGALERLELLAGGGDKAARARERRAVTAAGIEAEFPYTRDYAAFRVLDMLDAGRLPAALEVARTLFHQGIPGEGGKTIHDRQTIAAILVAQLSRYLEQRLDAALALASGMDPKAAAESAGLRGPHAASAISWLRRTPPARLRYRVAQVLDAERELKGSSGMEPEMLVGGLLARLSAKPER